MAQSLAVRGMEPERDNRHGAAQVVFLAATARAGANPPDPRPTSAVPHSPAAHLSNPPCWPLLLTPVEAISPLAFALSGLIAAARKRLDAVGACPVAGLAAFGGNPLCRSRRQQNPAPTRTR